MRHLMKWIGFLVIIALVIMPLNIVWADDGDITGPSLIGSTPADGGIDIGVSQNIQLQFSENIHFTNNPTSTSGSFTGDGSEPITIKRGSTYLGSTYTINNDTITLEGTWGTEDGSEVEVTVAAGTVQDEAAPTPNVSTMVYSFKFNLPDTTNPTISTTDPVDNATGVAIDKVLVITYSEAIQQGANWSNITVMNGSTSIPITPSISGNDLRIIPDNAESKWGNGTGGTYTLNIPSGAVEDPKNNAGESLTLTFIVPRAEGPILLSCYPTDNATGVQQNQSVRLTFDENMTIADSSKITIDSTDMAHSNIAHIRKDVQLNSGYLYIGPDFTYHWDNGYGATYTVTVSPGALKDTSNRVNNITYIYHFTTEDTIARSISIATPSEGQEVASLSTPVVLEFNRYLTAGQTYSDISVKNNRNENIPISKVINDKTLTIAPVSGSWEHTQRYTVTIPAYSLRDVYGTITYTFKTADMTGPAIYGISPAYGATNQTNSVPAFVEYSEPVQAGPNWGSITATRNNVAVTFNLQISDDTLYINRNGTWEWGCQYTINVPAGALTDAKGNPSQAATIMFSTMQKPVALSLYKPPVTNTLSGKTVTLYYMVDKKSNVQLDVWDNSSQVVVKTIIKKNIKANAKSSIAWSIGKRQYGTYTLRLTATPVDNSTASVANLESPISVFAKADVVITSCPKTWDVWNNYLHAVFTFNTACDVTITLSKGKQKVTFVNTLAPIGEGINTSADFWAAGNPYALTKGNYKITITINNGLSKDSASKTIKIIV